MRWQCPSLHSSEPEEISIAGDEAVGVSTGTPWQVLCCAWLVQLSSDFNQDISWQLKVFYQAETIFEATHCTPSFPAFTGQLIDASN